MNLWFYNTDGGQGRFSVLIDRSIAATSGPPEYGELLGKLAVGDTLLMYENGIGVVAIGEVTEKWDGKKHRNPIYYGRRVSQFGHEYRVSVDWQGLGTSTIAITELRRQIGYVPQAAIEKIVKWRSEVDELIAERLSRVRSAGRGRRKK